MVGFGAVQHVLVNLDDNMRQQPLVPVVFHRPMLLWLGAFILLKGRLGGSRLIKNKKKLKASLVENKAM